MSWTVFGAGNFLGDILDAIEANHETLGQLVLNQEVDATILAKIPDHTTILTLEEFVPQATSQYFFGFLSYEKKTLLEKLASYSLEFANLIHPTAYVAKGVVLGQGNFIGAQSVIGPFSQLGNFNTLNRAASIGHDSVLEDHNHVGPGATIAGRCTIGSENFFGAGSTVIDGLKITNEVTLGAGAVLVKAALEAGTYVGVPAQRLVKTPKK